MNKKKLSSDKYETWYKPKDENIFFTLGTLPLRHHHSASGIRVFDEKAFKIDIGCLFGIVIICFIAWLTSDNMLYYDYIKELKSTFINIQFGLVIVISASIMYIFLFSKKKEKAIFKMKTLLVISILSICILGIIKVNWDKTYTKEKFGQLYETLEQNKEENKDKNLSNDKMNYINQNAEAYSKFSVKSTIFFLIQFIIIVFIIVLLVKLYSDKEKKQKLVKDDLIVYDNEENIKF